MLLVQTVIILTRCDHFKCDQYNTRVLCSQLGFTTYIEACSSVPFCFSSKRNLSRATCTAIFSSSLTQISRCFFEILDLPVDAILDFPSRCWGSSHVLVHDTVIGAWLSRLKAWLKLNEKASFPSPEEFIHVVVKYSVNFISWSRLIQHYSWSHETWSRRIRRYPRRRPLFEKGIFEA